MSEPQEAVTAVAEAIRVIFEENPDSPNEWAAADATWATRLTEAAAPAIRAAERERIREMAVSVGAEYEERQPCSCGAKFCRGVLIRAHAPFEDLIGGAS